MYGYINHVRMLSVNPFPFRIIFNQCSSWESANAPTSQILLRGMRLQFRLQLFASMCFHCLCCVSGRLSCPTENLKPSHVHYCLRALAVMCTSSPSGPPAAVAATLCAVLHLQVGFFDDKVGPITLAAIVMVTLVAITVMAFIDVVS